MFFAFRTEFREVNGESLEHFQKQNAPGAQGGGGIRHAEGEEGHRKSTRDVQEDSETRKTLLHLVVWIAVTRPHWRGSGQGEQYANKKLNFWTSLQKVLWIFSSLLMVARRPIPRVSSSAVLHTEHFLQNKNILLR